MKKVAKKKAIRKKKTMNIEEIEQEIDDTLSALIFADERKMKIPEIRRALEEDLASLRAMKDKHFAEMATPDAIMSEVEAALTGEAEVSMDWTPVMHRIR